VAMICYIAPERGDCNVILQVVQPMFPEGQIQRFMSSKELLAAVPMIIEARSQLMVLAPSRENLVELSACRSCFEDFRIVLVLPDEEEESVTQGHSLRPRVVGVGTRFIDELPAILSKMLKGS
jgi:hypothetical protein